MKNGLFIGLLLLTLAALGSRWPGLDRRPLHNDEAVNAWKLEALWREGFYRYDPQEYHGPTLYYFSLPVLKIFAPADSRQWSDAHLRLITVFFGAGLILLLWPLRDGLGGPAILAAGALTAVSPAMVFYSRYFIHEILLVFFTLLLLGALWRYACSRRPAWAATAGAALGLMWATKETFVLVLAALAGAWAAVALLQRLDRQAPHPLFDPKTFCTRSHLLWAAAPALLVAFLFFSSFFTHPEGMLDAIKTYLPWSQRAGGDSPHNHPWYWYFQRLFFHHPVIRGKGPFWSEGAILALALIGAAAAFRRRPWPGVHLPLARFLLFYSLLLSAIYAAIPYKTPWCLLGFHHGLILLAGLGAGALFEWGRSRLVRSLMGLALIAALGHLAWQAWRANGPWASSPQNPYTYSQTSPHIRELIKRLRQLAPVHPDGKNLTLYVVAPESYWPLPWYLRDFKRIGWFETLPPPPYPPVLIVSAGLQAYLDEKTNKQWIMAGLFELRPKVALELYVNFEFWKKYVATLPRAGPDD